LSGVAVGSHTQIDSKNDLLQRDFGDGRSWHVQIMTENTRLNINSLFLRDGLDLLRRFFRFWGLEEREVEIVVDSLADWVDSDTLRRLNGAESVDIPLDSNWSKPENRPFLDVNEMERVRGMELVGAVCPRWKDFFSVYSGRKLDLQFVEPEMISAITGIGLDRAKKFVLLRNGKDGLAGTADDAVFEKMEDAMAILSPIGEEKILLEQNFGIGHKGLRRIVSRGEVRGTRYTIEVILAPTGGGPAQILSWKEF
ncbi:MAG: general secretion pathway protein GspK, partial [Chthoniobacterales bacterium]|nr:general secretion pathway protein GspK [Chthoniobacterales bacterium]